MRYLSLFSGVGGFELGIQQAYESNKSRTVEQRGESGGDNLQRQGVESDNISGDSRICDWTCIGFSEIDKYATQIYQQHFPYEQCKKCSLENERQSEGSPLGDTERRGGEQLNNGSEGLTCNCKHKPYGDITKINAEELPEFDLLVGGFPCQSFSIAGKRGGFNDTRGTLFFEIARILKVKQPRLLLLENVKGLLSHDEGKTFATIIATLDELGYDLQWQVLNSKNFGVPQNRERVFIVGHLRGTSRPEVFPITSSNNSHIQLTTQSRQQQDRTVSPDGISPCLASNTTFDKWNIDRGEIQQIRRLTPKECERLQGFPDGWTEGVSDTQRYKCLGNAVTVNVIENIMEKLVIN